MSPSSVGPDTVSGEIVSELSPLLVVSGKALASDVSSVKRGTCWACAVPVFFLVVQVLRSAAGWPTQWEEGLRTG